MKLASERTGKRIDFLAREYARVPALEFVKQVNAAYYKYASEAYDETPDIAYDAVRAWGRILGQLQRMGDELREFMVIDIGAGTGFVAARIIEGRLPVAGYVGYEPAAAMLEIARRKFRYPSFSFNELDIGTRLSSQIGQIPGRKIVTLNSVLHHIVWWEDFLADIVAVLKQGDCLVICHEPNSLFWENPGLVKNFDTIIAQRHAWSMLKFFNPLNYYRRIRRLLGRESLTNYSLINRQLEQDSIITKPLSAAVIAAIIDYSVPLCWREIPVLPYCDEGFFSIDRLHSEHLFDCDLVEAFTYQHLAISPLLLNHRWKQVEQELACQHPSEGAQFCLFMRKR